MMKLTAEELADARAKYVTYRALRLHDHKDLERAREQPEFARAEGRVGMADLLKDIVAEADRINAMLETHWKMTEPRPESDETEAKPTPK